MTDYDVAGHNIYVGARVSNGENWRTSRVTLEHTNVRLRMEAGDARRVARNLKRMADAIDPPALRRKK